MCGIAGKVDFAGQVAEDLVHRMCAAIEHRGPDSRGVFLEDGVGLGVQRLAIIDVAGGDQPIYNEDGSIVVVQNGEIYNYEELREQLIARGHRFSTHADTEVLVHLYEDYGEEMVPHLRGMFAFAIWDRKRRRLFVARDRVGKKPLFWARSGSRVWFASELRALLQDSELDRAVDPLAIAAYLAYRYVPHPLSALQSIRKLPPASTLTVTESGEEIARYWQLDYTPTLDGVSEADLEAELWRHIKDATRVRLMSEVPLGAFLSGGIDSSAVVAAMAEQMSSPVKTFSIGFPEIDYDEVRYARIVAERFGTDHREFTVEPKALEIMPKLARHYGEPYADPSAIPSFYLAELASGYVTVALNGDGGDESFAGYDRYFRPWIPGWAERLPRPAQRLAPTVARVLGDGRYDSSARTKFERLARVLAMSPAQRYAASLSAFDEVRRRRLLTPEFADRVDDRRIEGFLTAPWAESTAQGAVQKMVATDVETYLPDDLLAKIDIATMAHSVEGRSPFLDHHVMEFAASIPMSVHADNSGGKALLKRTLRNVLPAEILTRPKMGFGVPLARWFRNELRELPSDILLDPRSLDRNYFRRTEIECLISEHRAAKADHSLRLWVLVQLELWHREVLETAVNDAARTSVA
jgi:asparagine synthase (glutamine-hydrolysing)